MMTLAQKLVEAEDAYHRLQVGQGVVEVSDQSGERLKYAYASRAALAAYIADLKRQIAGAGQASTFHFSTSKGV